MRLSRLGQKIKEQIVNHVESLITFTDIICGLSVLAILWLMLMPYIQISSENAIGDEFVVDTQSATSSFHSEGTQKGPVLTERGAKKEAFTSGPIVASKKGTKYHRISCPGSKSIKEENRIYFQSSLEAKQAGYLPASNCPGL